MYAGKIDQNVNFSIAFKKKLLQDNKLKYNNKLQSQNDIFFYG